MRRLHLVKGEHVGQLLSQSGQVGVQVVEAAKAVLGLLTLMLGLLLGLVLLPFLLTLKALNALSDRCRGEE